jgi:cysteine-rich repeat protein
MREGDEECDDGGTASGDGCSSICELENIVDAPPARRWDYSLDDAIPSPFNPNTTITYRIPQAGYVELAIYDPAGRHVRTLVGHLMPAGEHEVQWDGQDAAGTRVASGVYLYRLQADDFAQTKRMVLLK